MQNADPWYITVGVVVAHPSELQQWRRMRRDFWHAYFQDLYGEGKNDALKDGVMEFC